MGNMKDEVQEGKAKYKDLEEEKRKNISRNDHVNN